VSKKRRELARVALLTSKHGTEKGKDYLTKILSLQKHTLKITYRHRPMRNKDVAVGKVANNSILTSMVTDVLLSLNFAVSQAELSGVGLPIKREREEKFRESERR
jgi:hypothetical protein